MPNLADLLHSYTDLDPEDALGRLRGHADGPLPPSEEAVNLVHALEQAGDPRCAVQLVERLTTERPDYAPAWARRSQLALARGDIDAALEFSALACRKDANCGFSRLNHGIALRAAGRVTSATGQLSTALSLRPDDPVVLSHYGLCLADQFQHTLALDALDRAIEMAPGDAMHGSNRLMIGQYHPAATSSELLEDALKFSTRLAEQPRSLPVVRGERMRIGYLSPDLYNHPVGRLFLPILRAHDGDLVEVTVFSDARGEDDVTAEIERNVTRFIRCGSMNNAGLAAFIHDHPVDVLVDLAGHTAGNRLPVLANRLAPVQVSFLGYSGSTGLCNMDAVVLGEHHCTDATQSFFRERVMNVPGTHLVYEPPAYLPEPDHRPHAGIRFCSFNHTGKLNTEVLACWADIVLRIDGSNLTLKWRSLRDPQFANWVRARFTSLGLDGEQLRLEPDSPHHEMLRRYNDMDIALDPFPYCGGLTTIEALVMGVPVVTLPWQRPVSRQTSAILKSLGMEDLVARTPGEYVDIAVDLALDASRLSELHQGLRARLEQHRERQAGVVAAGLESIYAELLEDATL